MTMYRQHPGSPTRRIADDEWLILAKRTWATVGIGTLQPRVEYEGELGDPLSEADLAKENDAWNALDEIEREAWVNIAKTVVWVTCCIYGDKVTAIPEPAGG